MKLLILSDIHANYPAFRAVLDDAHGFDQLICLGDIAGYYPYVNEVIDTLRAIDPKVCVMGNHDHALVQDVSTGSRSADLAIEKQRQVIRPENLKFLEALPDRVETRIAGKNFFLFHGTPSDALNGRDRFWEKGDLTEGIYCCGHTHVPFHFKNEGTPFFEIINPGSCGFPRDKDPRASYAVLDTDSWVLEPRRVDYPIASVLRECETFGLPPVFANSLKAGCWTP